MEKNGCILLTEEDLREYNLGSVSDRVTQLWGLSLQQLKEVIDSGSYEKL